MFRRFVFRFLFFAISTGVCGQGNNNLHNKIISLTSDILTLDTLSLVPGSLSIKDKLGNNVDTSLYKINYTDGKIIFNSVKLELQNIPADSISIAYKTFPFLFTSEVKHKNADNIRPDLYGNVNPFNYKIESKNDDIFKMDGLNKSGSISRGITIGNNQDMVVNSNLNLQLSGHLSNNIDILLAATDNNIPVQPEGNTQQLQEFDKVFIQLSKDKTKLIAGDFQMTRPQSYFMNFNKKAQGISFSTALETNKTEKDIKKHGIYSTTLSAAVSRGKFARNVIQGIESNQGPYRLRGAENELFIIVLSGTEKVYIDGRVMDRGQENDYVINYNTGEITFTAKQLITKDKRIVVEFQYSDKNYARSLVFLGNDYEQNRLKVHLNIYSEQDSKNQPLQQSLSDVQKKLLSDIGDTLSLAVSPNYSAVSFNNDEVLYEKMDTVRIGTHVYLNVFKYINYIGNNIYRVGFSNVGEGKGNYIQILSDANGKVFQWIMPDTTVVPNRPRGNYEPVIQLITPKKKQLVTAGVEYLFSKKTKLTVEAAVSSNDINTFSSKDSYDDVGYALKMNLENTVPIHLKSTNDSTNKPLSLITNVNYEYTQKYFSFIERYRTVEFERDWNRGTTTIAGDQHILGTTLGLTKKDVGTVLYKLNAFFEGEKYNATKHNAVIGFTKKGFNLLYDGSFLQSASTINTEFYRHKSTVSQKIKRIVIGAKDEFEQNKFSLSKKDSLLGNSYQFWEWQAFVQNADTTKNRYGVYYKQRTDYNIKKEGSATSLIKSVTAESYGGFFELNQNPNNQLKLNVAYRILTINDSLITVQKPDNSLVARLEYNLRLWKGVFSSGTYYEIGSGLEIKKEYSFIRVAPGQGIYIWNDYNRNGIKELNEFEIAPFPDQAIYIKVYTPTNQYIKTYSNQFSQTLMLNPGAVWANKTGFKKIVGRFANQTAYRVDRKSIEDDLSIAYNPFVFQFDSLARSKIVTLNSSFRNTLFFNQLSPVFGVDITYQDVNNKILLVNGIDTRENISKEARLRWNITQKIYTNISYKNGNKINTSEYFKSRDYDIMYYEIEPKLNFQPNTSFRATVSFKYSDKTNKQEATGGQKATLQDYGAEIKYNVLNKGSLNMKVNFIQITFNDNQNTSLAFEMLEALKTGNNATWGVAYQRTLSNNLQLNLTYDGRKSEGTKTIHTGGIQVRAYF